MYRRKAMRVHRIVLMAGALFAAEATGWAQTMSGIDASAPDASASANATVDRDAGVSATSADAAAPSTNASPNAPSPSLDLAPMTVAPSAEAEAPASRAPIVEPRPGAFQRPYPWERENWLALVFGIGFGGGFSNTMAGSLEAYYQRWLLQNVGFGARFGGVGLGQSGSFISAVVIEPGLVVGAHGVGIAGYVRAGAGAMIAAGRYTGSLNAVNVLVSGEAGMQLFPWAGHFGMSFAARFETYHFAAWSLQFSSGVGGRF